MLAGLLTTMARKPVAALELENKPSRQPVVFVSHGPGPLPILGRVPDMWDEWTNVLRPIVESSKPKALCVVSAHWETPEGPTILAPSKPKLLYDYYGFPQAAYDLKYPCPGIPRALTERVKGLLEKVFLERPVELDTKRGLDHGTFVPLKGIVPDADIPVFQIALQAGGDHDWHVRLGEALAPLRDEGVMIVGSGMTFHHFDRNGFTGPNTNAIDFNEFLKGALLPKGESPAGGAEAQAKELRRLVTDDSVKKLASKCHPTHEHLTPLIVAAAAAGFAPATLTYETPGAMDFVWFSRDEPESSTPVKESL